MRRPGFVRRGGRAECGTCHVTEGPTPGGRASKKADGWHYSGRTFGWVCRDCAIWVRRFERPADTENVENSAPIAEIVDNPDRRFGPRSDLTRAAYSEFVALPTALRRARRRTAGRSRSRTQSNLEAHGRDRSMWSPSRWREWSRWTRSKNRVARLG